MPPPDSPLPVTAGAPPAFPGGWRGFRSLVRDPLVHFLIAGALLFAAYSLVNRGMDEASTRVVRITEAEVAWLKETWTRQWQRPPSDPELRGLVTDYLKESLLALEAKELGLDEGDTIVRRRLAQKMEFLVQDTARIGEPGEDVLRQFHEARRDQYRSSARISFTQVFFRTEGAARRALGELGTRNASEFGDPSTLERSFVRADEQSVAGVLGPDAATRIFALAPGRWQGPVASVYGFHVVQVSEVQAGEERPFDQVRTRVLEDWHRLQQEKATEQYFASLLKKYDVVVDEDLRPLVRPFAGEIQ